MSGIKNNLYLQLFQVSLLTKHDLMDIAGEFELSVMQLYTLCLLANNNSIPMNSLSARINCDASNITGIVDRLFNHKFITREENPDDRREKMIKLTKRGENLCNKIDKRIDAMKPAYFETLNSQEKKQFSLILSKLIATAHK